jgi:hypothetical protein
MSQPLVFLARVTAVATALCSLSPAADAQHVGPEFQINTYTTSWQVAPDVAMDAAGKFVVVWASTYQDGSERGIFAQRFDPTGAPLGSEFRVNDFTPGNQNEASVAAAPTGEFLVVWDGVAPGDPDGGVFGQRYDAAGAPAGGMFQVNSYTTSEQGGRSVAADGVGRFVVAWSSDGQDGSEFGVFARRFDSTGSTLGSEFQVNTSTVGYQLSPSVAADSAGNFLVVWTTPDTGGSVSPVFGRFYSSAGVAQGPEFQISASSSDPASRPTVAAQGGGGFIAVWQRFLPSPQLDYDLVGRRVSAAGQTLGVEFPINTFTPDIQWWPRVASEATGEFVVTWTSGANQDGSYAGTFARRFDAGGVPETGEFQVNSFTTGNQANSTIAGDGAGRFVVAWMGDNQDGDGTGVFAQRLTAPVFADAFEAGVVCAWSDSAGSGDLCP